MKKSIICLTYTLIFLVFTGQAISQGMANVNKLQTFSAQKSIEWQQKRTEAEAFAKVNNIPIRYERTDGTVIELQSVENGIPQYYITENVTAARSINTDDIQPLGWTDLDLIGTGITVHEWDGGAVLTTHQELAGRVVMGDGATAISSHSTHVAGTLIASGVKYSASGMARNANLKAFDWNADESEMASEAASGALISNHSYSYMRGWEMDANGRWVWYGNFKISRDEDYRFGFYDAQARDRDQIAFDAPYYMIVKSAGNNRGDGPVDGKYPQDGPYDCIGGAGSGKNILTVGAVNDINLGYTQPSDVVMTSFSGWGPTDDGRIKPDIVANGTMLHSCIATADNAYSSYTGTSMSSPSVAGSLVLLQEHHKNLNSGTYMLAATLKALVIHTTDEAGDFDGPDYMFGWGLMNTRKAAFKISENQNIDVIDELVLNNGDTYTRTVHSDGVAPIKVTICWTDVPGTPVAAALDPIDPMLVNDLDLRITMGGNTYYPWKLNRDAPEAAATNDSENNVDNVEVVYIAAPTAGDYTVTVDHDGTLVGGMQAFSIIYSGISEPVPTPPIADFSADNTTIYEGETVNFSDLSTGNPTIWSWTFEGGDPLSSTEKNPSVTYYTTGTYSVTLYVSNSEGNDTETKTAYITVSAHPPVADFTSDKTDILVGESVNFTDLSTYNPTYWSWSFEGGEPATSTAQNPKVTYATAGSYYVTLTVTNDEGSDVITKVDYITVSEPGTYCTSQSSSNDLEWISQVIVGGTDNPSGASFYSDFTSITINLAPGSSNNVTLAPHFTNKSQREFWRVWIDFNRDGDFEDADETLFTANNQKDVVTGTINIPAYASGTTRMRVTMKSGSSPSPCESFDGGEVEDYTVNIVEGEDDDYTVNIPINEMTSGIISGNVRLELYPNPAENILYLNFSSAVEPIEVSVYNNIGDRISTFMVAEKLYELNTEDFSWGVYYISAKIGNNLIVKKFIKM